MGKKGGRSTGAVGLWERGPSGALQALTISRIPNRFLSFFTDSTYLPLVRRRLFTAVIDSWEYIFEQVLSNSAQNLPNIEIVL